ncbi:MAG TPA: tetratricopeptide repeat protein [Vicinamibacterales bacterium]|nr:tetratricopeptide repeat protein [Vicinamibacterales bacterium]
MRRRAAVALVLLFALAACAKKPATLPAPGAPRFADFIYPAGPSTLGSPETWESHQAAWAALQAGDPRTADRSFSALLKQSPGFYPASAGLGYAALARKDTQSALAHFDRALQANPTYVPALAGRGEALLAAGRADAALEAFEAALAADPALTSLRSRVDVLKFRNVQQHIESARKAADANKTEDARREYLAAIAASPQSAFLYRELAVVERKSGDTASALVHAEQAVALDAADVRALMLIAELREAAGDWARAADAYAAVNAVEPGEAVGAKIEAMREKAAFDALPAEYRGIETSETVTRAQLAALLGVRLEELLRGTRSANVAVMTDVRGSWAAPWILAVARARVMEPFSNHTFQPSAIVRRGDLAQAVSRVLALIALEKPRLAARWRDPRPKLADVSPGHLQYPAVARAVSSGVLSTADGEAFHLSRPVTGAEAVEAVTRLAALARR